MAALHQCIFGKSGRLSSAGPETLAFVSDCYANFQRILGCFIPNFKSKYEDSENIKEDGVNTLVLSLRQIKRRAFLGHPVHIPGVSNNARRLINNRTKA